MTSPCPNSFSFSQPSSFYLLEPDSDLSIGNPIRQVPGHVPVRNIQKIAKERFTIQSSVPPHSSGAVEIQPPYQEMPLMGIGHGAQQQFPIRIEAPHVQVFSGILSSNSHPVRSYEYPLYEMTDSTHTGNNRKRSLPMTFNTDLSVESLMGSPSSSVQNSIGSFVENRSIKRKAVESVNLMQNLPCYLLSSTCAPLTSHSTTSEHSSRPPSSSVLPGNKEFSHSQSSPFAEPVQTQKNRLDQGSLEERLSFCIIEYKKLIEQLNKKCKERNTLSKNMIFLGEQLKKRKRNLSAHQKREDTTLANHLLQQIITPIKKGYLQIIKEQQDVDKEVEEIKNRLLSKLKEKLFLENQLRIVQ